MKAHIAIVNTGLVGHFHAMMLATLAPEATICVLNNSPSTDPRQRFHLQGKTLTDIVTLLNQHKRNLQLRLSTNEDDVIRNITLRNIEQTIQFIATNFQVEPNCHYVSETEARSLLRKYAKELNSLNRKRLSEADRLSGNLVYMDEDIAENVLLQFKDADLKDKVNVVAMQVLYQSDVIIAADGEKSIIRRVIFNQPVLEANEADFFSADVSVTTVFKKLFVLTGRAAIGSTKSPLHHLEWLLATKQCLAIIASGNQQNDLLERVFDEIKGRNNESSNDDSLFMNSYFNKLMATLQAQSFHLKIPDSDKIKPTYQDVLAKAKAAAAALYAVLTSSNDEDLLEEVNNLAAHAATCIEVLCDSDFDAHAKAESIDRLKNDLRNINNRERLASVIKSIEALMLAGEALTEFKKMNDAFRSVVESLRTNDNDVEPTMSVDDTEKLIAQLLALLKAVDDYPSPSDKRHEAIITHFQKIALQIKEGTLTKDQFDQTMVDLEKELYGKKPLSIKTKMIIGAVIGAVVGLIIGGAATFWIGGIGAFTGLVAGAVGGAAACALGTTSFGAIGFFQGSIANLRYQANIEKEKAKMNSGALSAVEYELAAHFALANQSRSKR